MSDLDLKTTVSGWVEERIPLYFWCQQSWLTTAGIQGRESHGEGILEKYQSDRVEVRLPDGSLLWMSSQEDFITEQATDSADGFEVQVRTLDHSTWILFKPHTAEDS